MEIEVLAPAGSYESLVAAVNAGADAIYIGGEKFGARAYADNPKEDELLKGITYAHHFGVRVYMTVNTLLKENEMKELYDYLLPYYRAGLDAVIVQDMGVFHFVHQYFQNMDIHISTQVSITGPESVKQLQAMGATRVVPARELSLAEIAAIDATGDIEIECFVHGALCYAYSGQCLMSSLIGGRSGNRGRCAQTCRLPYSLYNEKGEEISKNGKNHLLSCKDLCSLDILPDLIEAGVDSLKIEGRMKSPRYTAGVVRIWRKYVDLYKKVGKKEYQVEPSDRRELLDLFDRGGQTDGYYTKHNGKDMIAFEEKPKKREVNEKLFDFLDKTYVETQKKHDLVGKLRVHTQMPMILELSCDKAVVCVQGAIPDVAKSRSATVEEVKKQIQKMGGTWYQLKDLEVELDDGLFIPVKALNDLRREAIAILDEKILSPYYREVEPPYTRNIEEKKKAEKEEKKPFLHVVCETKEQLQAIAECSSNHLMVEEISFEADTIAASDWKNTVDDLHQQGYRVNLYLPHIFRLEAKQFFNEHEKEFVEAGFDALMIRSLEEVGYVEGIFKKYQEKRPRFLFDYTMYNYNHEAADTLNLLGADKETLPVEFNLKELKKMDCAGKELLVYGRIPMMVSAQCLKKNTLGCDHKMSLLTLQDRYKKDMPVKNRCTFCYNSIYNAQPLSTIGLVTEISNLGVESYRLWFTTEKKDEVRKIVDCYVDVYLQNQRREEPIKDFTRGHFKRGIE